MKCNTCDNIGRVEFSFIHKYNSLGKYGLCDHCLKLLRYKYDVPIENMARYFEAEKFEAFNCSKLTEKQYEASQVHFDKRVKKIYDAMVQFEDDFDEFNNWLTKYIVDWNNKVLQID